MTNSCSTRLMTIDDAPVLAELLRTNRDFLAPWEPVRADDYFTVDGQRQVIRATLDEYAKGASLPTSSSTSPVTWSDVSRSTASSVAHCSRAAWASG